VLQADRFLDPYLRAVVCVVIEDRLMNFPAFGRNLCIVGLLLLGMGAWNVHAQQTTYPNADAAASAFVQAVRGDDKPALAKVLGADWKTYIPTDDIGRDDVNVFLKGYDTKHSISQEGDKAHLVVGVNDWILPIPIVKAGSGWHFDVAGARDEIRARRIGNNEYLTQLAMLAYYDAQRDYASKDRDGDTVLEYAQKLISAPGKHDGLYWTDASGSDPSPLGPYFQSGAPGDDFHGYHFHVLTAQGPSAPGGAYNYIVGKHMTNGFALVAWPSQYGQTGVMSFMVSHDGQVFEKDLGKDSASIAQKMTTFDPDSSWQEVKPEG